MLKQIRWLLQQAEQKSTDLNFLQRVKASHGWFGPKQSVNVPSVGPETLRICLEYHGILPAHPAQISIYLSRSGGILRAENLDLHFTTKNHPGARRVQRGTFFHQVKRALRIVHDHHRLPQDRNGTEGP
jgi:hypothetical protein